MKIQPLSAEEEVNISEKCIEDVQRQAGRQGGRQTQTDRQTDTGENITLSAEEDVNISEKCIEDAPAPFVRTRLILLGKPSPRRV